MNLFLFQVCFRRATSVLFFLFVTAPFANSAKNGSEFLKAATDNPYSASNYTYPNSNPSYTVVPQKKEINSVEVTTQQKEKVKNWFNGQAVRFLENKGQMADVSGRPIDFVLFEAQTQGVDLFITEKGLTYVFLEKEEENDEEKRDALLIGKEENEKIKWSRIDMELRGAEIKQENVIKEGASDNFKTYFKGHCPNGISDVYSYSKVTIKNIYPFIDWVFYNSNEKGFKYDFVVVPVQIRLR